MIVLDTQPGTGTFPTFVSVSLIDSTAMLLLLAILIGVVWRYTSWRRSSPPKFFKTARASLGLGALVSTFFSELLNRVLLQKDVINNDRTRRFTHLAMFWGFIGLSLTTTLDYIFNQPGNYIPFSGGALSSIRWLGNVSGAVMVLGATIALGRLATPKFRRNRAFGDLWFSSLLFLAGITGFIAEYLGDQAYTANPSISPAAAYSISLSASPLIVIPYGIHLAAVALLLVTAPASAFIHAIHVPSMRYVERVGGILSARNNLTTKNEQRRFKEVAMLDQVEDAYEEKEPGKE